MNPLDAFPTAEPEEPWDDLSLAEQAAEFHPGVWEPAHVDPEGLTALPDDFPVEDPFGGLRESSRRVIAIMVEKAHCRTKDCALDDRDVLAEQVAEMAVDAIGELQGVAAALFAHGEPLVAELLIDSLCTLTEDILKPFFDSVGLDSEIGGEG